MYYTICLNIQIYSPVTQIGLFHGCGRARLQKEFGRNVLRR